MQKPLLGVICVVWLMAGCASTEHTSIATPITIPSGDVYVLGDAYIEETRRLAKDIEEFMFESEAFIDIKELKYNKDFQSLMKMFDDAFLKPTMDANRLKEKYNTFLLGATPQTKDVMLAMVEYHKQRVLYLMKAGKIAAREEAREKHFYDLKNQIIMSYSITYDNKMMALMAIIQSENELYDKKVKASLASLDEITKRR